MGEGGPVERISSVASGSVRSSSVCCSTAYELPPSEASPPVFSPVTGEGENSRRSLEKPVINLLPVLDRLPWWCPSSPVSI